MESQRRGRPRKNLDPNQIERMAAIGCTVTEIAGVLQCGESTLRRNFGRNLDKGRAELKMRLRKAQIEAALGGNVTALIWLGKQYLEQSDKVNLDQKVAARFKTLPSGQRTTDEMEQYIARRDARRADGKKTRGTAPAREDRC